MASQVSGADLGPILNRLKNTPRNRPMDAGTFADWSTEAGDTVTMKREGTSFQSQVHSSSMTWRGGSPTVEMNSTGNEKRDPITKVSKQKYNRSGAGGRISQQTYDWQVNQEHLLYEVRNDMTQQFSRFEVDINGLHHTVGVQGQSISTLENTANGFRTRLAKVVDENGTIKVAEIVTAINGSESYVITNAEHVLMGGNTLLSAIFSVNNTGISAKRSIYIEGTGGSQSITLGSNGNITALKYIVPSTGNIEFRTGGTSAYTLKPSDFGNMVKTAETVGTGNNTLRLTFWNGEHLDFSKATSLEGGWSGRNYTVKAKQNGIQVNSITGIVYDGIVPVEGTITKSSKTVYKDFKVFSDDGNGNADELIMTKTLSINASSVYDDGWSGCYSDIGLNYSSNQTISPGSSITIYPACKPTPSGSHASITTKGVKVTASTPSASDINLPTNQISRSTTAPSGTGLSTLAQHLVQAYLNTDGKGRYVRFAATINGGTGTKWYYIYM